MDQDLIERMTSKLFEDSKFSSLMVQLCGELTKDKDLKYQLLKRDFANVKPKDVGIGPYFTLDETSKLESVFLQSHPEVHIGDSGGSSADKETDQKDDRLVELSSPDVRRRQTNLTTIMELSESATSRGQTFKLSSGHQIISSAATNPMREQEPKKLTLNEVRRRMHHMDGDKPY